MTNFFQTPQILPHTILYLYHSLSCSELAQAMILSCTLSRTPWGLPHTWVPRPECSPCASDVSMWRRKTSKWLCPRWWSALSMKEQIEWRKCWGESWKKLWPPLLRGWFFVSGGWGWSKNLFLRRFQTNLGGAADSISDSNPDFPPQNPAPLTKERFRQEHEFDAADEVPLCLFFGSFFGLCFSKDFGSLRLWCSVQGWNNTPNFLGSLKLPGVNTCSLLAEVVLSLTIRTTGPSDRGLGNIAGTSEQDSNKQT